MVHELSAVGHEMNFFGLTRITLQPLKIKNLSSTTFRFFIIDTLSTHTGFSSSIKRYSLHTTLFRTVLLSVVEG